MKVRVIRGRQITKGSWYADQLDTPDPYLILHIKVCIVVVVVVAVVVAVA